MPSKQKGANTQYCRIFQWVDAHDPEFAAAIRFLCLEGTLSPSSSRPGVTFLYPTDDAYRAEIIQKTYSGEGDDAEKMVQALIIPDSLQSAADFRSRPVGNILHTSYSVAKGDGAKVSLSGNTLEKAGDFKTLSRRKDVLAVWLMSGSERLSTEAGDYNPPKSAPRSKLGGGGAMYREGAGSVRSRVASDTEHAFDACMKRDRCKSENPYLGKVVGLLNFLKTTHPSVLTTVSPVLDYSPFITFYLLLEPYKTSGEYLISDDILNEWKGHAGYASAVDDYLGFFPVESSQSALARADSVRQKILGSGNLRKYPKAVTSPGVYPDAKKLWQDQFRYVMWLAMSEVLASPKYSSADFSGLIGSIRNNWPGNDYQSEAMLTALSESDVAPRTALFALTGLLKSTDFMYCPSSPQDAESKWGGADEPVLDQNDWRVYSADSAKVANLKATGGAMVHSAGISDQCLSELKSYVANNGQLPPDVASLAK